MAIIHFSASSAAAQKLIRECPKCGTRQQTKPSQQDREVLCTKCGESIPPRKR